MRLTVADAKASRIPQACGVCSDDPRFLAWLNDAIQRLLVKGLYIGTFGRFRICATDGCITLPPQIASIERVAVCGRPVALHDQFYEFLDNGFGPRSAGNQTGGCCPAGTDFGIEEANLRGWYPSFDDIRGTSKKLRLVCDLSSDVNKRVLVLGYDENNNWIRTVQGGVWSDGEIVLLAQSPGTDSTHFFDGGLTGIQFLDARDRQVWLYERDTIAATSRMIGHYQHFETRPNYSRYFFPSILAQAQNDSCNQTLVDLIGKLEFIPVVKDTDYLIISNLPALKFMCQASKTYEEAVNQADLNRAAAFEAIAVKELDNELTHYLGEGRVIGTNFMGSSIGRVNPVETLY
jgi:hypothetical protein